jgi:geranylgeranyl pyrophosphate synthase
MLSHFKGYMEALKPGLDQAFNRQISHFLDHMPLNEASLLKTALEAGKKIRGCLLCLISDTLGGSIESAMDRAVAVELIQAASLIHDDIVDHDTMRRRLPAAWTLEGTRRAVLLGDVIFAAAIGMANELGREDGLAISRAIAEISRGAFHEPLDPLMLAKALESNKLEDTLYEKIIHLKTAALFGAACRLGALGAEAVDAMGEKAYRYGSRIGEAYQIADDLQEIRQHLSTRSLRPEQLPALVPALLRFAKEIRPHLIPLLRTGSTLLEEDLLACFRAAEALMEVEIESRLKLAASELDGHFPQNAYGMLARRAPWDLIRMFNES